MPQAGFTPIQTYNSPTAGHIPVYTDLYAGELAINTTDEKLYFKNTGGTVKLLASTAVFTTTGSGSYVLATSPTITGHPTIEGVTSTGATGTGKFVFDSSPTLSGVTLSDGTANGVAYLNSSKVLTSGSALTFDGTNFGVSGQIATGTTQNTDGQIRISNTTTRAAGNKYGIRFADNTFETNASIYVEQGATGSNAAALVFGVNAGTGGINLTSGTEQMRLTSTGLGIGTSSPAAKLDVVQAQNGATRVQVNNQNSGASAVAGISLEAYGGGWTIDVPASITYVNPLNFTFDGSTKATLDSSGNLGLGVVPSAWSGYKAIDIGSNAVIGGSTSTAMFNNSYWNGSSMVYKNTAAATYYQQTNAGTHAWSIAPSGTAGNAISFTQAMTLDASGNLLVGTTSAFNTSRATVTSQANNGIASVQETAGGYCFLSNALTNGGTFYHASFTENGTQRGSITSNGSSTTYATSSDYRLKNVTGPITNSGAYIDSLNPVEGTWKSDGSAFVGLIAHEVQGVSRTTVATGIKDGKEMQGMDYSSAEIIANLIAELQSLRKRVNQLENKL